MKKFLLYILTIMYMTVSSGIALEVHYCMGKKAGVDFYKTASEKCNRCGMKEKKKGCCNDEHRFYKLKDSHNNVSNEVSFHVEHVLLPDTYCGYTWQIPVQNEFSLPHDHSPPVNSGPSACILHCLFRI